MMTTSDVKYPVECEKHLSEYPNPENWVASIFIPESTSRHFAYALKLLKSQKSYHTAIDDRQIFHSAIFKVNDLNIFFELYSLTKDWKGSRIEICGEKYCKQYFSLMKCIKEKVDSNNPAFCFGSTRREQNPCGCNKAITKGVWYDYNQIIDGIITLDKKQLTINTVINLLPYRYCPYLNIKDILKNINDMPDDILKYHSYLVAIYRSEYHAVLRDSRDQFFKSTYMYINYMSSKKERG
jgi:hypothetical protein